MIAQPASRLHFPPAHDITGTGVIDDYYHPNLADPSVLAKGSEGAIILLRAAEAAFAGRGVDAAFVVCPAKWRSKLETLEAAGYKTAMVWSIKQPPLISISMRFIFLLPQEAGLKPAALVAQ